MSEANMEYEREEQWGREHASELSSPGWFDRMKQDLDGDIVPFDPTEDDYDPTPPDYYDRPED